ncbi:MAG TPA: hypothetical protein VF681_03565 [Abditibacteriaceae bacterium]|jgi:hypothetical protein
MKKALFSIVGIAVAILSLSGTKANTQQSSVPVPQAAQPAIAALEAQIAKLEVGRIGLFVEWKPNSAPVRAADKKLAGLHKQLAQARPSNPNVSAQAEQKAIQAKIAQLESVHNYLAGRYQANHLDSERKYVTNYLSVLRNRLAQVRPATAVGV